MILYKKYFFSFCLLLLVTFLAIPAFANFAVYEDAEIIAVGFSTPSHLGDANYSTYTVAQSDATVTVSRTDSIGGLYIVFDRIPDVWTITDPSTGKSVQCGQNAFLHEYVDITQIFGVEATSLLLTFPAGTVIGDIYAFSPGTLPDWVQIWQPPCSEADLLLISSHADDEQLFFAGILPLYAGEMSYTVQVAYIVQHFEAYGEANHIRPHEQLNGLWAVGVKHYPVMTHFPDLYSESREEAIRTFGSVGITPNDFTAYITELLRRFRPLVVVSHDLEGEYGHGTHILCADALLEALTLSSDSSMFPESAQAYGTWIPEKVYLHLYKEHAITLNLDIPLESFGGKTAFEMTQYGFSFHKSQHWTWFNRWLYGTDEAPITKATQVKGYSPCRYGLYHTTVGYDVVGGDFMENVQPYAVRQAEAPMIPEETVTPETESAAPEVDTAPPQVTPPEPKPQSNEQPSVSPVRQHSLLIPAIILFITAFCGIIVIYSLALQRARRIKRRRRQRR